ARALRVASMIVFIAALLEAWELGQGTDANGEERPAAAIHASIGADRGRPIRVHRRGGTRSCDRCRVDSLPVRPARRQPGRARCDIRTIPLSDAGPLAPGVRDPDHHAGRRRVPDARTLRLYDTREERRSGYRSRRPDV